MNSLKKWEKFVLSLSPSEYDFYEYVNELCLRRELNKKVENHELSEADLKSLSCFDEVFLENTIKVDVALYICDENEWWFYMIPRDISPDVKSNFMDSL